MGNIPSFKDNKTLMNWLEANGVKPIKGDSKNNDMQGKADTGNFVIGFGGEDKIQDGNQNDILMGDAPQTAPKLKQSFQVAITKKEGSKDEYIYLHLAPDSTQENPKTVEVFKGMKLDPTNVMGSSFYEFEDGKIFAKAPIGNVFEVTKNGKFIDTDTKDVTKVYDGKDHLISQFGTNFLIGGGKADTFQVILGEDKLKTHIEDFTPQEGDKIIISNLAKEKLPDGNIGVEQLTKILKAADVEIQNPDLLKDLKAEIVDKGEKNLELTLSAIER